MQTNDIQNELSENFIEYAAAINSDRAIPDARSGLKPVARRILWSAFESGQLSSRPHVKSARIVGNVMSSLHPHGDASIYEALVRLSKNWVMRYPLINIHGNNGNITGDGPAHMRYTEARLSKLAEDGMLRNIKKHNVEFMPNYDETQEEPVTLPALFPNLLCNPNNGIGVSLSCHWLPHNLREVATAIFDYMDGKEPTLPGPDFPTGGIVINPDDIPNIMQTGHGSVKVRGKYKIEKQTIIFYEIPYEVSIETILKDISDACDKKEIEGISEIRDESGKQGLRIVITCNKDANPNKVVNQLFAKTSLQKSISYNQVALVDKAPTELNLKDCIQIYINHNTQCLVKETKYDLQKAEKRHHIVEGLLKALEDIDNIISLIKKSKNSKDAKKNLISTYSFSDEQGQAIVDMKLGKLASLEKIELEQENAELLAAIDQCNAIINSSDLQQQELRKRLSAFVQCYGDSRRTEIMQVETTLSGDIPENVIVAIGCQGNIKKVHKQIFILQHKNKDSKELISTKTDDTLMLFTSKGQMYKLSVNDIPTETARNDGVMLNTLIDLQNDEKVLAAVSLSDSSQAKYVIFITKQGRVKKTSLEEYSKLQKRKNGAAAIKLKPGDAVANVVLIDEEELMLVTKHGMSIHIATADITPTGRATIGVIGMKIAQDDEIVTGLPISNETDTIAIVTERGFGKRCQLNEFTLQNKNGKGILIHKNEDDSIVGAAIVNEGDRLSLSSDYNRLCLSAIDFPLVSRLAQGNMVTKGRKVSQMEKIQ